ncbi:MAG: LysM peptidoglycan-binding domain-containing protein [Alphaproteobacteria bacterium]
MNQFTLIGLLGVVVIALAIGLNYVFNVDVERASDSAASASIKGGADRNYLSKRNGGIPVPALPPVAAYRPGDPKRVEASVKTSSAEVSAKPPKRIKPIVPAFDVVRVNPRGDSVIAGRAAPGATVQIFDGAKLSGNVVADKRGEWIYLPSEPLPSGDRELSLIARNPDGVEVTSESNVVLAIPRPGWAPGKAADGAKPGAPARQVLAVLVPNKKEESSRVLQAPAAASGLKVGDLTVGVVDYDDNGNVTIAGKGRPAATIRLYIGNKPVGAAVVNSDGEWRLSKLSRVIEPGIYKLRADEIVGGAVVARVETLFSHAKLENQGDAPKASSEKVRIIVQPGNSLWRIARRSLGAGTRYTIIYKANKGQISNPDLIYPGQVFNVPKSR